MNAHYLSPEIIDEDGDIIKVCNEAVLFNPDLTCISLCGRLKRQDYGWMMTEVQITVISAPLFQHQTWCSAVEDTMDPSEDSTRESPKLWIQQI